MLSCWYVICTKNINKIFYFLFLCSDFKIQCIFYTLRTFHFKCRVFLRNTWSVFRVHKIECWKCGKLFAFFSEKRAKSFGFFKKSPRFSTTVPKRSTKFDAFRENYIFPSSEHFNLILGKNSTFFEPVFLPWFFYLKTVVKCTKIIYIFS